MKILTIIIIAVVAFIVLSIVMAFVSRHYRVKYNLHLFPYSFLMLLAEGCIVLGIFAITGALLSSKIGYILVAVGAVIAILVFILNIKKCGGAGLVSFLVETICAIGVLGTLANLKNGTAVYNSKASDERYRQHLEKKKRK